MMINIIRMEIKSPWMVVQGSTCCIHMYCFDLDIYDRNLTRKGLKTRCMYVCIVCYVARAPTAEQIDRNLQYFQIDFI